MSTAMTPRASAALAKPSFIKEGDLRGTENITSADIRPPALKIAQSTSNETKRSEADKYIEGLREGDFFNTITKEIYGEGPLKLVIVNQLGHRHIEFKPINEGGGVEDFNVPDGDPRTEFTEVIKDGKKVRVRPRATKFYDYLVLVITGEGETERRELMTVSLKSTQLKKATTLNTLLKGSKLPSFAHLFTVTPVPERGNGNSWYGWKFAPAGYVTEEIYNEAGKVYDSMVGKKIEVETEVEQVQDEKDDDIPF